MAEGVLFDIAGEIIKKLGSLAVDEIALCWGVKVELKKLKDTVESIRAVLLDAEEQYYDRNNQVTLWLGRLREVLYDADEMLDDFSYETLRRQVMSRKPKWEKIRFLFSGSNRLVYNFKLGHKIKDIQERLDAIAVNKQNFTLKVLHDEKGVMMNRDQRRETDSTIPDVVVGREDDKNKILKFLLDSGYEEDVSILPIVGIGGLGKTTLAQLVFNDERVTNHFQLKLWVCVSDSFDVKRIVKQMLELATHRAISQDLSLEALKRDLKTEIGGKMYLLVLDDVWNEDQNRWDNLKKLLRGGSRGSKIVITTRSKKVAEVTSPLTTYELGGLSEEESLSLLTKIIFRGKEQKSYSVVEIGKEIVKKCAGVPLAIKTIGSLLSSKKPETWQSFMTDEFSKISQQETDIFPTLKLSYDHLPSHLKHCFAYCKIFPKDYEIGVEELIRLWVAQGFVRPSSPETESSIEEIGMECFEELLWRCFFQEARNDERGIFRCKMHDLMHDLATSMGGSETIILNSKGEQVTEKTRHVSLFNDYQDEDVQLLTSFLKANNNKVQTCFLISCLKGVDQRQEVGCIVCGLRNLIVLSLRQTWQLRSLPSCIGKLKHLRYLDLSDSYFIEVLPTSITRLHNLQFLIVSGCQSLEELPKDINDMVSLKYLDCSNCIRLRYMPRGLGELTSLERLRSFMVGKEEEEEEEESNSSKHTSRAAAGWNELSRLDKLNGDLTIRVLKGAAAYRSESQLEILKKKRNLVNLSIESKGSVYTRAKLPLKNLEPHSNLRGLTIRQFESSAELPTWFSSLTKLVTLNLSYNNGCKYLPPLGRLPHLQNLDICYFDKLEYIEEEEEEIKEKELYSHGDGGGLTPILCFPSLKKLEIRECTKLKGWKKKKKMNDDNNAVPLLFPCLSSLVVYWCPYLTRMPLFPTLDEHLKLVKTSTKPLQETMKLKPSTTASSSSSAFIYPLSKLKKLEIGGMEELDSLPEELQNLTSLQRLDIHSCPKLTSLPQAKRQLTSLHTLIISGCPLLETRLKRNQGVDWPNIAHIPYGRVDFNPQSSSLPPTLHHPNTFICCNTDEAIKATFVQMVR